MSTIREIKRAWFNEILDGIDLKKQDVAEKLGIARQTLSAYSSGGKGMGDNFIDSFCETFSVNFYIPGKEETPPQVVNGKTIEERLTAVETLTNARGTRFKDLEDDYDDLKKEVLELRGLVRKAQ